MNYVAHYYFGSPRKLRTIHSTDLESFKKEVRSVLDLFPLIKMSYFVVEINERVV